MDDGDDAVDFRRIIRQCNSAFAFTSVDVDDDNPYNLSQGILVYQICGVLRYTQGSLFPYHLRPPSYVQTWLYDAQDALSIRLDRNPNLRPNILQGQGTCYVDVIRSFSDIKLPENFYKMLVRMRILF